MPGERKSSLADRNRGFAARNCGFAALKRGIAAQSRGFGGIEFLVNIALLGIIILFLLRATSAVDYVAGVFITRNIEALQLMVFSYREDHSFLPGDDPLAPRRFDRRRSFTRQLNGRIGDLTDNSVIDGFLLDPENLEGEQFRAWQDLRYANKIDGDPETVGIPAMPKTFFGGLIGFDGGNLGMEDGSLCLTQLPGLTAQIIDENLDDGVINTGLVVSSSQLPEIPDDDWGHYDEPDSEPYDPDRTYLLCTTQLPL